MLKRFFTGVLLLLTLAVLGICLWRLAGWETSSEVYVRPVLVFLSVICIGGGLWWLIVIRRIRERMATPVGVRDTTRVNLPISTLGVIDIQDVEYCLPVGFDRDGRFQPLLVDSMPSFHDELQTASRLPIRASWVKEVAAEDFISDEPLKEKLFPTEVRRALLLALGVMQPLVSRHVERGFQGGALQIHCLLPARWHPDSSDGATRWMEESLEALVPGEHLCCMRTQEVSGPADAAVYLNGLMESMKDASDPSQHLVVACESFVDPKRVRQWEEEGRLYSVERPEGLVPGEGACGLFICLPTAKPPTARLARLSSIDIRSVEQAGASWIRQVEDLIGKHGPVRADIACLLSDSEQRSGWLVELAELFKRCFPEPSHSIASYRLPIKSGELGAVSLVAAIGVAARMTSSSNHGCVVLSERGFQRRSAALLIPLVPSNFALSTEKA